MFERYGFATSTYQPSGTPNWLIASTNTGTVQVANVELQQASLSITAYPMLSSKRSLSPIVFLGNITTIVDWFEVSSDVAFNFVIDDSDDYDYVNNISINWQYPVSR
jgi:hypothetical protein